MSQPKFTQIKQHIFAQIESGKWAEYQKVPSENELASQFQVSRMTSRRALQELTDEGVLNRSKGAGTFVASFKSQSSLLEIRNIADEITGAGHKYSAKPLLIEKQVANEVVAKELDINIGETVYFSKILHMQNDLPIQLEQRYVNAKLVPRYIEQNFAELTPHEYLSQEAPLTEVTHEIEAVICSTKISTLLAIDAMQPCLQVKRRTGSRTGAISFAILTSPSNRYRLGGHLTFSENF